MTFKDLSEIIEQLKKLDKTPDYIQEAREYHKELKALVYGDEYKELLLKIEHIESEKKAIARKKYARPIKDINAKILEPITNVYSATGGGKEYDIKQQETYRNFLKQLTNVRGGLSIEKFLDKFWSKDLYIVDPNGLIFLEWKDSNAYPTYKSIDVIRYYEHNGMNVEYVIFEPKKLDKGEQLWRVYDDSFEYYILQKGENYTELIENRIENPFGKCPGRINSDLHNFTRNYRLSFIDNIIETEKEILRDRSVLSIFKFLNGFSTPFRPKIICPNCRGLGKNGIENCTTCNGKGVILDKDVTDEIIIPVDLNSDGPVKLPTNFAGFISPDIKIWDQYKTEENDLFNQCFESIWGTRESESKDQTAMSVIINTQPMISKLNSISDLAQSQEQFFTELLANFYIIGKNKEKRISTITYGRNYIIQPPEFLLEQYQKSNEKEDPIIIRDRKLIEYLTSKYKNDPSTLKIELIKKQLEPYIHYNIRLVKEIYGPLEAQKKGLFTDWWEQLDNKNQDIKMLEQSRDEYFNEHIINFNSNNNE